MADIEKMTDLVERIARAQLWDEPDEDGEMSGKNGDGISREFQESREEEAQDWILEARDLVGAKSN